MTEQTQPKQLTAEDLLSLRNQPPKEPFEFPGRGTVVVHGLSNLETSQWRAGCDQDDKGRINDEYADAKLIVRCVHDAEGKRIFTAEHITRIVDLPELILSPLVAKCMKVCGIGKEADEEILKNYGKTVTGSS